MMKKNHGNYTASKHPSLITVYIAGDAVEERTERKVNAQRISVFHHASLRDGRLANGCISCMPPKPAPRAKKV